MYGSIYSKLKGGLRVEVMAQVIAIDCIEADYEELATYGWTAGMGRPSRYANFWMDGHAGDLCEVRSRKHGLTSEEKATLRNRVDGLLREGYDPARHEAPGN